jgi:hypothetical protein
MKTYYVKPDGYFVVADSVPVNAEGEPLDAVVIADKPNDDHVFDDNSMTWVYSEHFALERQKAEREQLKQERNAAVANIKVTTSTGKTFDGDETSQTRMSRAIVGMQAANAQTITWVLSDNVPAEVTLAELSEALVLAGQAQAAIWVIPE